MDRVLIIDDDRELCALVQRALVAAGVDADCCHSGQSGLLRMEGRDYQLVILDVMMPGFDGFDTLEKIRARSCVPVLMLTAKGDGASKVRGLRAGADDYLPKPFDLEELSARVLALIRRYTCLNRGLGGGESPIRFSGLSIDPDARVVQTAGGPIELPPKEFDLLLLLARNQGRVLTKQRIYEEVWGEPYAYDDSTIMAIVSRLRKKIEPDQSHPSYIQTVRGVGYRFSREA
ncbi:PhoP family transcriptional regulator [Olsenella sp. oral taxon 807]|uniref:response regulator transcription factor n=1 Tax=Olsenella sp. oral taxon 807 TaxID=712411 RepID=UPI000679FF03|nr:response regulator transcription factor [Olsenella sp. oral taxon 807]AKT48402.1 PhoP family transcriptional regulator [Olsenella sp. oral taxon 807]